MTVLTEAQRLCRICGDAVWGPIWLDTELPNGKCPNGATAMPCPAAMQNAQRAGIWRKIAPEHFDASGKIIQGRLVAVIEKVAAAGFAPFTGRKVETPNA